MIKEDEEEAWRECCCGITEMCRSGFICMGQAWNWKGGGGWRGPEHRSRSRRIVWLIRPEEHQSSPVTTCPSPPPPFKWPVSQLLVLNKLKQ